MPDELVVHCVKNKIRFKFTREDKNVRVAMIDGGDVRVAMIDGGAWLIADPLYSPWLIGFVLKNPRVEGMVFCEYEFSPDPGNMRVAPITIFIKHSDIVRINTWLEGA